jgi:membrane-associated phospholipid phosphatase
VDIRRLSALLIALTGLGIALGALITGPLAGPVNHHLDRPVASFVLSHPSTLWDSILARIEVFGTVEGAAGVAGVVGGALALATRSFQPLCICFAGFLGAAVLAIAVRAVVTRPAQYGPAKGFPSGHVLLAVVVYGTAGVLATRSTARLWLRRTVFAAVVIVAIGVAWARVYRLDHVASDVMGSMILGVAWVYVVTRRSSTPDPQREHIPYFSRSSVL